MRRFLNSIILSAILFALLLCGGCSWYTHNRCWIGVDKYNIAKAVYMQLGSIKQTEKQLKQFHWRGCEVREAIYWLREDLKLDDDEDLL